MLFTTSHPIVAYAAPVQCSVVMKQYFEGKNSDGKDGENYKFGDAVQKIYSQEKPNSELTKIGLAAYVDFKTRAKKKMDEQVPTSSLQAENIKEFDRCKTYYDEQIDGQRRMYLGHVISTAAKKKQTAIIQKYEALEVKMRDLNNSLGEMLGLVKALNKKVGCFIKTCSP